MWELHHFGGQFECTGTIHQALQSYSDIRAQVSEHQPYINNRAVDVNQTPPTGAIVTFRPRMSGKA